MESEIRKHIGCESALSKPSSTKPLLTVVTFLSDFHPHYLPHVEKWRREEFTSLLSVSRHHFKCHLILLESIFVLIEGELLYSTPLLLSASCSPSNMLNASWLVSSLDLTFSTRPLDLQSLFRRPFSLSPSPQFWKSGLESESLAPREASPPPYLSGVGNLTPSPYFSNHGAQLTKNTKRPRTSRAGVLRHRRDRAAHLHLLH